jgi:hypothetical protein
MQSITFFVIIFFVIMISYLFYSIPSHARHTCLHFKRTQKTPIRLVAAEKRLTLPITSNIPTLKAGATGKTLMIPMQYCAEDKGFIIATSIANKTISLVLDSGSPNILVATEECVSDYCPDHSGKIPSQQGKTEKLGFASLDAYTRVASLPLKVLASQTKDDECPMRGLMPLHDTKYLHAMNMGDMKVYAAHNMTGTGTNILGLMPSYDGKTTALEELFKKTKLQREWGMSIDNTGAYGWFWLGKIPDQCYSTKLSWVPLSTKIRHLGSMFIQGTSLQIGTKKFSRPYQIMIDTGTTETYFSHHFDTMFDKVPTEDVDFTIHSTLTLSLTPSQYMEQRGKYSTCTLHYGDTQWMKGVSKLPLILLGIAHMQGILFHVNLNTKKVAFGQIT